MSLEKRIQQGYDYAKEVYAAWGVDVEEAIAQNVAAPVITMSLLARLSSRRPESYAAKVLAVLRNRFGGHSLPTTTM